MPKPKRDGGYPPILGQPPQMNPYIYFNQLTKFFFFCSLPQEVKDFVKLCCLRYIGTGTPLIQATLGILIATIAAKGELRTWPELIPSMLSNYLKCLLIIHRFCQALKYIHLMGIPPTSNILN